MSVFDARRVSPAPSSCEIAVSVQWCEDLIALGLVPACNAVLLAQARAALAAGDAIAADGLLMLIVTSEPAPEPWPFRPAAMPEDSAAPGP